jgi:hypothetical protein
MTLLQIGANSSVAPPAWTGEVSIETPVQYQLFQRTTATHGDIYITGTYSGLQSGGIQASFNGGAWVTISASPTGGTFSGTLSDQLVGQGILSVRFADSQITTASQTVVGIGDKYLITGDSNHVGPGYELVQVGSNNGLISVVFAPDATWKPHFESVTEGVGLYNQTGALFDGGTLSRCSYFGALANLIMNNANVPVAWIPMARGSTSTDHWSYDNTLTASALWNENYDIGRAGIMVWMSEMLNTYVYPVPTGRRLTPHKAVLCTLGTNGGGGVPQNQSLYTTELISMCSLHAQEHGAPHVLCLCHEGVGDMALAHAATLAAIAAEPEVCLLGPDFTSTWSESQIHYATATEINTTANAMYQALRALEYYS